MIYHRTIAIENTSQHIRSLFSEARFYLHVFFSSLTSFVFPASLSLSSLHAKKRSKHLPGLCFVLLFELLWWEGQKEEELALYPGFLTSLVFVVMLEKLCR